jgi:hypothetical protein
MSEKKRFWILLALLALSLALLYIANTHAGQVLLER